ncbi:hypothetical protein LY78DRAFT_281846 [Colletotrichum sublineola]|nr:hypothetical protein LY78DRAFT_281846 [Colletotrichum sublineola]
MPLPYLVWGFSITATTSHFLPVVRPPAHLIWPRALGARQQRPCIVIPRHFLVSGGWFLTESTPYTSPLIFLLSYLTALPTTIFYCSPAVASVGTEAMSGRMPAALPQHPTPSSSEGLNSNIAHYLPITTNNHHCDNPPVDYSFYFTMLMPRQTDTLGVDLTRPGPGILFFYTKTNRRCQVH